MNDFLTVITVVIVLLMVLPFYRLMAGPTIFDRILGVGVIGSKTLVLLTLVGFLYNRIEMFVDIVIAYSLLNFIGTLAIAKFVGRKGYEP
jgi:multicomponent Na+:H+ antiporter subunit F